MPKAPSLEDRIAALGDLRRDPDSPATRAELTKALASKINILAAKAARIAGECKIDALAPQMVDAFDRFMQHPATNDRRSEAKLAVIRALEQLEYQAHEPFLRASRHVQNEPSYSGHVDTAAELRAIAAIGLVRTNYPDVGVELVRLLADREREVRIGAVRAIAYWGTQAGALLLRLKTLMGDREPEVLAECFTALLFLEPARSQDFVASYLDHEDPAIAEGAALALGESHRDEAFEILKAHVDSRIRPAVLLGIALLRKEAAIEYLLDRISDPQARRALEIYKDDPAIQEKIRVATQRA